MPVAVPRHVPHADIKQFHGKEVEVKELGTGAVFRVALADTHPCDSSHLTDSDDIAQMNNMHEVRWGANARAVSLASRQAAGVPAHTHQPV